MNFEARKVLVAIVALVAILLVGSALHAVYQDTTAAQNTVCSKDISGAEAEAYLLANAESSCQFTEDSKGCPKKEDSKGCPKKEGSKGCPKKDEKSGCDEE